MAHCSYNQALARLDSLVNYEKQVRPRTPGFKLANIRRLLAWAGNPQAQLNNVILVAGTKGKGSVCYMIEAGLRGCGLKTGLFLSPHVTTVRERIQLAGRPITSHQFSQTVGRLWPLVERQPVSYFELTVAMAFDLFVRHRVDYAVVEVGLGGRLDATNLSHPQISVITRIGLDHVQTLGTTLRQIAREKAGIMRPGRPVVIAAQKREAFQELARACRQTKALPIWVTARTRVRGTRLLPSGVAFHLGIQNSEFRIRLPLLGRHQIENCRTALCTLSTLAAQDPRIRLEPVIRALQHLSIPARCQLVRKRPPIIVDSCHNPDSGLALARVIRDYVRSRVVLVYGSLTGKLVETTVRPLKRWLAAAIVTAPDSPRAIPVAELVHRLGRLGIQAQAAANSRSALRVAGAIAQGRRPIVVAGSFYLAAEVLAHLKHSRILDSLIPSVTV